MKCRKRDKKELVYVYESKALVEHTIATVYQRMGNAAAAREAYGRALQEDLSYYPAHMQLAYMAIEVNDTTTALAEMDLAAQLRNDDASVRYIYGATLAGVGRPRKPKFNSGRRWSSIRCTPHRILDLPRSSKRPIAAPAPSRNTAPFSHRPRAERSPPRCRADSDHRALGGIRDGHGVSGSARLARELASRWH